MNMRRATILTAGLAMATSIGFAGVGMASATPLKVAPATATSAASSALKITPGQWTLSVKGGGCEILTFTSTGTFSTTEFNGDAGSWAGGGSTIALSWTAGNDTGLLFSGAFVSSPVSYKGSFGGTAFGDKGKLVMGATSGC
jgi:hypothetical protein